MPRPPRPDQLAALTKIRECMTEHGEEVGARLARASFPAIDKATWSRWCKQVREENARFAEAEGTPDRVSAERLRTEQMGTTEVIESAPGVIDFIGELQLMLADCNMLRAYAAPVDSQTGLRKPRNPMMLSQAIKLRALVLGLAQRHAEGVWAIERTRALQADVFEVISDALRESGDKQLTARVVAALRKLQSEHENAGRWLGAPVSSPSMQGGI
jgi:hypothetical protein